MLNETIVALATPPGIGAIAVIRISGESALYVADKIFVPIRTKKLSVQESHTVHLGHIVSEEKKLDKVLLTIFKAPNSYTGENVIEISCHGSSYIQQRIIQLILDSGCRMANPGEFTLRAFLNGKMDLSQAEAVADLISSKSAASHEIAMNQMRGGFSNEINQLRQELLNFASLIELELDFSQEDVEFADRAQFSELLDKITGVLKNLIDSFALGNVLKNGIPIAIVGEPNVGKSTLLNALLNEDKAIVSDVAGTTRDSIEDEIIINGINYRFIDTAGIRKTSDNIEKIGIKKTFEKIDTAELVLYLLDANDFNESEIQKTRVKFPNKRFLVLMNKSDKLSPKVKAEILNRVPNAILISAKSGLGIKKLKSTLVTKTYEGQLGKESTVISNSRHYSALLKALDEVEKVKEGIAIGVTSDLISIDIKQALFHLGEITGSITTDDLLGNIFSNFCIGK